MKPATTYLLITSNRVARADHMAGSWVTASAPRPGTEPVRAALALGGKAAGQTWVLSSTVWTQEIRLHAAQVAGLTPEALRRALAFEVEPFSGIPAAESATGFHCLQEGVFEVAQATRAELDAAQSAIRAVGGNLAGLAPGEHAPEEDSALAAWWPQVTTWLSKKPVISPPAAEPSPHRFRVFGVVLSLVVAGLLTAWWAWHEQRKTTAEGRNAALAAVAQGLASVREHTEGLRAEAAALDRAAKQQQRLVTRRGAVAAALEALAALRPEDVVVTGLSAEGASQLLVRGLALEAEAVDEFSVLLAARLAASGWGAQTRDKVGRHALTNGGPWDFAVELGHEEAKNAPGAESTPSFDP